MDRHALRPVQVDAMVCRIENAVWHITDGKCPGNINNLLLGSKFEENSRSRDILKVA
jgi:hypothetical protein